MSLAITVYFIEDLLPLILLAVFCSFIPFVNPPQIQFGIRIGPEFGSSNIIKALKYEYSFIDIVGISSMVIVLTYILGPSIFVVLLGIPLFLAFSLLLYEVFRFRARNVKKLIGIYKENYFATAVFFQAHVKVKKWLTIIPWFPILVPLIAGVLDIFHFRIVFSNPAFSASLWAIILTTIIIEGIAFLVLGVSPFQNSESPVKNALQMSKFNRVNFYLLIFLSTAVNLNVILSNYFLLGASNGNYIYADLFVPSFLLLVIIGIGMRYGQVGWKLFPQARESKSGKSSNDDDNFWKFGIFYYNHNDPSIMVPKRFGFGYTLNFANPLSLLMISSILLGIGFYSLFVSGIL